MVRVGGVNRHDHRVGDTSLGEVLLMLSKESLSCAECGFDIEPGAPRVRGARDYHERCYYA